MLHFTGLMVSFAKIIVIPDVKEPNNNETVKEVESTPLTYTKAFQVHTVIVSQLIKNYGVLGGCKYRK